MDDKTIHAIVETGYSNLADLSRPMPWFRCACGWESSPGNRWWEDVGEEYDDHLRMTKE